MSVAKLERRIRALCKGFALHRQDADPDPIVCARLYWPIGRASWYIVGYNPRTYVAYGYVVGVGADEWGYFSVPSLLECKIAGVVPVKLDEGFKAVRASRLELAK